MTSTRTMIFAAVPLGAWVIVAVAQGCGAGTQPGAATAAPAVATANASDTGTASSVVAPDTASAGGVPEQPVGSAAASAASSSAPKTSRCPSDMVDVSRACIDRYEAPNQQGTPPLLMQTAEEAVAWCEERGKRLCTEDEWQRACQGPEGLHYPYGARYEEHSCNQDAKYKVPKWGVLAKWPADAAVAEASRLNQSEPSGARPTCGSAEGVFDLTGNAAEWVVKLHDHPEACQNEEQRKHTYVIQGCSWVKCYRPPHEPACDYVNCAHASAFRSYEVGFRCCKDPSE